MEEEEEEEEEVEEVEVIEEATVEEEATVKEEANVVVVVEEEGDEEGENADLPRDNPTGLMAPKLARTSNLPIGDDILSAVDGMAYINASAPANASAADEILGRVDGMLAPQTLEMTSRLPISNSTRLLAAFFFAFFALAVEPLLAFFLFFTVVFFTSVPFVCARFTLLLCEFQ